MVEINYTLDEIDAVALQIIKQAKSKTLLFHAAMGAGKTTLIKALVKALGSTDTVQSPTYAIVNEYQATNTGIYHFDLYRLKNIEEAYQFGIEEYLHSNHWVFIEWPDIITDLLPDNVQQIHITVNDNASRNIIFS